MTITRDQGGDVLCLGSFDSSVVLCQATSEDLEGHLEAILLPLALSLPTGASEIVCCVTESRFWLHFSAYGLERGNGV